MNDLARIETVGFAGTELECVRDIRTDDVFVSVRRVCEGLEVDYSSQLRKLRDNHWATVRHIPTVALDGKTRDLAMIDLDTLAMWLATISPSKCSDIARPKVILYQKECVRVLRGHFFGRLANEPLPSGPTPVERETRYPDGRIVVERFEHRKSNAEELVDELRRELPKPRPELDALRRRFNDGLLRELRYTARYKRLSADERGDHIRELNSRLKVITGLPREEWLHKHYEMAADWLLMHEGLRLHWTLEPVQEARV